MGTDYDYGAAMTDDVFDDVEDESGRVRLHTACPSGHPTIQAFTPVELQDGLNANTLTFECLYCGAKWAPSASQRALMLGDDDR
jgi:hypothetical protein